MKCGFLYKLIYHNMVIKNFYKINLKTIDLGVTPGFIIFFEGSTKVKMLLICLLNKQIIIKNNWRV